MASKDAGFTLVEAMTTMALLAIALAVGVPAYAELAQRLRLQTTLHHLSAVFAMARATAIARRVEVVVCADDGQHRCAKEPDWSRGWIVFLDTDGDRQPNAAADLLRVGAPSRGQRLHATRRFARFQPDGRAAGTNLSVHVCRGTTAAGSVVVNNLGRVRSTRQARAACDP
ncbi:GspH/FimT family pseudopilin [Luteimonas huabeiensis]|uniref:GspH/FimT family pseudopilin n=1 Tax=Luteimonas huabeiensis TaxID=1244513 RepID=UPI0005BA1B90|nr:GspH/FimT family pseudopilin [Luteimonas huabeiensis]